MKFLVFIAFVCTLAFSSPFFDNDNNTKFSPSLPKIEDFDKEILDVCGNWGDSVDPIVFKRFLKGYNNGRELTSLYETFKKDFNSRDHFLDEFTNIWFKENGFVHIFCGEPKKGDYLGGLHFFARLNQAHEKGWAKQVSKEYQSANDDTYMIGVEFKNKDAKYEVSKNPKSYNLTMNAEDIFIEATKAYLYYYKQVGNNKKGLTWFVNKSHLYNKHKAKIVIQNGAIVTFYPIN